MNEIDTKEFQEWYNLMKERANHILNDSSPTNEQKHIFIERSIEPLGTWKLSKLNNGIGIHESQRTPANGKQLNSDSLSKIMGKYKLVKDEQGIKMRPYVED